MSDFKTWKEVQKVEIEYWWEKLNSELKGIANVWDFIENWQDVKDIVDKNTSDLDVEEEFAFDSEVWIQEILEGIKPYFESWLEKLSKDKEIDYSDYVENFWTDKQEEIEIFEQCLPQFLQDDINALVEGERTNSTLLDCLYCEVQGSINSALYDNMITKEQAEYLRKKYL